MKRFVVLTAALLGATASQLLFARLHDRQLAALHAR